VAIRAWLGSFDVIALDSAIANRAVEIRKQRRIRLPDAIVWASAEINSMLLVSRNTKDFPADEPGVRVPYKI
jgi:predicted nucleic acid-binding protein